jgi:hypothetical protein
MADERKCLKEVIRSSKWEAFVALIQRFYNVLFYHREETSAYRPTHHSPPETWRNRLIFKVNLTVGIMPAKHSFLTLVLGKSGQLLNT